MQQGGRLGKGVGGEGESWLPRISAQIWLEILLYRPLPNLSFPDSSTRDSAAGPEANTLPTMTSYTKIPDEERAVISVDALQPIARIEDNTYGGFTE